MAQPSNLTLRLATAAVCVPLILWLLYRGPSWGFYLLVFPAVVIGTWELFAMTHPGDRASQVVGVIISAALSIALDKALAKKMVRHHGFLTPDFLLMSSGKERLPKEIRFPVIVKPVAEGSSKGVFGKSVVDNEPELRELARELAARYRQPALVENYIAGREFTVGMLGERRPKVLPIMEVVFTGNDPTPVYDFSAKLDWTKRVRYDAPAKLEPGQQREIERAARGAFAALGCRDVANRNANRAPA